MAKLTRAELTKDVIVFFRKFAQPDMKPVSSSTLLGKVKGGFWLEVPTLDQAIDELLASPFFPNSPAISFTTDEEKSILDNKGTLGDLIDEIASKLGI